MKGIKLTCTYFIQYEARLKDIDLPYADCLLKSGCITAMFACSKGHLSNDSTRSQCGEDVRACSKTASILPNISGRCELYNVLQLRQENKLLTCSGNDDWYCDRQLALHGPLQCTWVCSQDWTVRGGQVASDMETSSYRPTSSNCLHDCASYQAAWHCSWRVCRQFQVDYCLCSTLTSCEPQQQSLSQGVNI